MRDKELRLALVCYGGISLAVYMHGITKEIWRLARASQAHCDPDAPTDAETDVYRTLFAEIEETAGLRLRVLVDIVAGASAGGINGVFLAQAVSSGQSLEPLTDMWLNVADIEELMAPEAAPATRITKFWALPIAWMLAGRGSTVEETVEPAAREEVRDKLAHFVRARWFEPPFGGEQLLNLMLNALDAMAKTETTPRLLPPGQPLDLFVTMTDFGGHPERLRINSPPEVIETEHRLVCSFRDRGFGDGLADTAELAFAARATSSFPGAFPPFMVGELDKVLQDRKREWPGRDAFLAKALPRHFAIDAAEKAALIDGSVLANAPFRPAIEALRERPARRQIDRRFVYIDPSPGHRFGIQKSSKEAPGFFQTIIGALSELPRQQPIRDNLEQITKRSDQIERMLAIMEKIRAEVEAQVVSLFGYTLFLDFPTPKRLIGWRRRAQARAAAKAGYGHTSYGLFKIDGVIDRIADLFYSLAGDHRPDAWRDFRDAIAAVVHERGAADFGLGQGDNAAPATLDFLRTHDLSFRIRRLRLLARRLTEADIEFVDEQLTAAREAIYESLAEYLECKRSENFTDLAPLLKGDPRDVSAALDRLGDMMNLRHIDARTDARLSEALSGLSKEVRRPLLLSYLGFPFFDIATLPLLRGEGLDEFDPIRVDRISPDDADAIRSGGAEATLKGIQFNNFGAFFSRAYRENDYLWGRLHGADRLIDIVLSTVPPGTRMKPGRVTELKRAAFRAILDHEQQRLHHIDVLFDQLRKEVG